jgi:hypothetical protein
MAATVTPKRTMEEDPLRILMDDTIMVLAAAHRASFDAVLATAAASTATATAAAAADDDGEDDDSDIDVMNADVADSSSDDGEEDPEVADTELQRLRWESVANGVRAAVAAYDTARARERALVDSRNDAAPSRRSHHPSVELVASLSGPVCQQRGRYLIWRRAKQAEEAAEQRRRERQVLKASRKGGKPVSTFNVARGDNLGSRIDQIMRDATKNLPTTLGRNQRYGVADACGGSSGSESDDDVDDVAAGEAVEIYQPPAHCVMNEEDVARRAAMHQSEDELLQRVQRMQLDHYERFKRWIDVDPLDFEAMVDAKAKLHVKSRLSSAGGRSPESNHNHNGSSARRVGGGGKSQASVASSAKGEAAVSVEEYSVTDVALLCAELEIDAEPFRRTSGRILATLSMEDLRLRMPFAEEDDRLRLHAAVQARRGRSNASRAASSASGLGGGARANVHDVYASARGGEHVSTMMAEATGASADRERLRRGLNADSDPLAALKRRLDTMAGSKGGASPAGYNSASARRPLRPSQMNDEDYEASMAAAADDDDDITPVPAATKPRHTDPAVAAKKADAAATAKTTAAPSRSGRWAIVEYSDDDAESD